jgi:hypothetical protein
MHWGVAIAVIVAAALAYGYWDHTHQSRHLTRLFSRLAEKYHGELKRANLLVLPQLRFELEDRRFFVAAMATSGHVAAGSSGYSGPFTFVDLSLPFDTGQKVRVERNDSNLARGVDRVIDAMAPGRHPATGHAEFDEAFRIECSDPAFAFRLLGASVRRELLNSRLPRLDARLNGHEISVHMDGIARSEADLEGLIELAMLLADHCPIRADAE